MTFDEKQKGVTLYLVLVLVTIMLGVSLGLVSIFLQQVRLVGNVGSSMPAFHAAEAGAERILRLDTCLIVADEDDRIDCIKEVSGIAEPDIHASCKGPGQLSEADEQECRKQTVENMPAATRDLDSGASYAYTIRDPNGDCEGNPDWGYCATSTGSFRDVVRRVEIVR